MERVPNQVMVITGDVQQVGDVTNCVSVRLALQLCVWATRWRGEKPEMGPLVKKLLQA